MTLQLYFHIKKSVWLTFFNLTVITERQTTKRPETDGSFTAAISIVIKESLYSYSYNRPSREETIIMLSVVPWCTSTTLKLSN